MIYLVCIAVFAFVVSRSLVAFDDIEAEFENRFKYVDTLDKDYYHRISGIRRGE